MTFEKPTCEMGIPSCELGRPGCFGVEYGKYPSLCVGRCVYGARGDFSCPVVTVEYNQSKKKG